MTTVEMNGLGFFSLMKLPLKFVAQLNWRSLAFKLLKRLIARKYPQVQSLTTQELAQWLDNPSKPQPIVLDARNQAEYQQSHLQHAQWIDPQQPDCEFTQDRNTPVVVYCSVGYRSARVADLLTAAGYTHVYNLEGSIFQWVNEKRPVFHNNDQIPLVHPYNAIWGQLLKPQHRAELASEKLQNEGNAR